MNVSCMYTRYRESSKSLEGDCGMDGVALDRLLTPLQEGTYRIVNQEKKNFCKQGGKMDYSKCSQQSLLA